MVFSSNSNHQISEGTTVQSLRQIMLQDGIAAPDCDVIFTTAANILSRCIAPENVGSSKGLIYGNIQSGKTAVIIALIALGLDNGHQNFVVLTSDLNDLYEQTLNRIQSALHTCHVLNKQDFRQPPNLNPSIPLIFVSSKNRTVLPRLTNTINQLNRNSYNFLIIDDEADQASLDTNVNNNQPPSSVNTAITNLRNSLNSYTFLQTTATPQALFLQDSQDSFRPSFVEVTQPGAGYVGGDHFFGNDDFQSSPHLCLVHPIDLTLLSTQNQLPQSLRNSLFVFLAGAAILRLLGSIRSYTYLLHTSFRQAQHTQAAIVISQFFTQLQGELSPNQTPSNTTMVGFMEAYNELQHTFGNNMPSLNEVVSEVRNYILSTSIYEVNASTGQGVDPNPTRMHIIYIGGTKIGRGVTIRNLLVTYYGRDAQSPQMDTVLQHARMYGYRQNELPAIRIYLPSHLAQRFYDIHASDNAVREVCSQTGEPISVLPLSTNLNPTRRNVLNQMTVDQRAYVGGRQYFPRQPIAEPFLVNVQTQQLDSILSQFQQERYIYTITIDNALQILNFQFGTIGGLNGAWDDELIRTALSEIRDSSEFGDELSLVIISRTSNISRSSSGLTRAIVPGSAGNPPYEVDRHMPALLMTRLTGSTTNNWYGHPFWVPVVRFPDGNYAFAANYS